MHKYNVSWYTYDQMMKQQAEARRCLHDRLRVANAKAGKLSHLLFGGAVGFALATVLKGCV